MLARGIKTVLKFPFSPTTGTGNEPYINIPGATSLIVTSTWSVSCWWSPYVFPGGGNNAHVGFIFSYQNPTSGKGQIIIKANGSGSRGNVRVNTTNNAAATANFNTTSSILLPRSWYHTVLTWDGTTVRMYTQAVADGTGSLSGAMTFDATSPMQLGNAVSVPQTNLGYSGLLAEVRWYSVTLSQSDITRLFNGGKTSQETSLIGYWKGNDGRGTIVRDYSGNNNNGTLLHGAQFYNLPTRKTIRGVL